MNSLLEMARHYLVLGDSLNYSNNSFNTQQVIVNKTLCNNNCFMIQILIIVLITREKIFKKEMLIAFLQAKLKDFHCMKKNRRK